MTRHLVPKVLLATALALGGACSSGDGTSNEGTRGSATGGKTATGGASAGATGGEQTTGGVGGLSGIGGLGGVPEQAGGRSGAGGAATGGHPSGGIGGAVLTGTGGGAAGTGGGGGGASGGAGGLGGAGVGGRAGAGARGGAGGAGGAPAYEPCPMSGIACKILPFGDSITRGVKSSDDAGYRSQLFKLIVAAKQKVTFTGSLTNGPTQVSAQPFPRMHEGHAGWTIDPGYNPISSSYGGISSLVPSPALDGQPNIILLHIGTNDVGARDPAGMATRLEALLDKVAQDAPDALIVLAQITPGSTPTPPGIPTTPRFRASSCRTRRKVST